MSGLLVSLGVAAALLTSQGEYKPEQAAGWTNYQQQGIVMHYYSGIMERVARYRGVWLRPGEVGFASTQRCSNIGRVAYAKFWNYALDAWGPVEKYRIADCSRPGLDLARHIRMGLVLEVGWVNALAHPRLLAQGRQRVTLLGIADN